MQETKLNAKAFDFSQKLINVYLGMEENEREYLLSQKLLESSKSITSYADMAIRETSRMMLMQGMEKAYQNARDTQRWLRLLESTELVDADEVKRLKKECKKLIKMLKQVRKGFTPYYN